MDRRKNSGNAGNENRESSTKTRRRVPDQSAHFFCVAQIRVGFVSLTDAKKFHLRLLITDFHVLSFSFAFRSRFCQCIFIFTFLTRCTMIRFYLAQRSCSVSGVQSLVRSPVHFRVNSQRLWLVHMRHAIEWQEMKVTTTATTATIMKHVATFDKIVVYMILMPLSRRQKCAGCDKCIIPSPK